MLNKLSGTHMFLAGLVAVTIQAIFVETPVVQEHVPSFAQIIISLSTGVVAYLLTKRIKE